MGNLVSGLTSFGANVATPTLAAVLAAGANANGVTITNIGGLTMAEAGVLTMGATGYLTQASTKTTGSEIAITATPAGSNRTSAMMSMTAAGSNWGSGAEMIHLDATADASVTQIVFDNAAANYIMEGRVLGTKYWSIRSAGNQNVFSLNQDADLAAGGLFRLRNAASNGLTDTDNQQNFAHVEPKIKQTATAAWTGIFIEPTVTSEGTGASGTGNAAYGANMPSGYPGGHAGGAGTAWALWAGINSVASAALGSDGVLGHKVAANTLAAAATTFAVTGQFMTITGDGGGNTVATITGGPVGLGMLLTLLFVDALVTITDDDSHTANTVDLNAAFTSADDTVLQLYWDGTSWYEVARSVN